MKDFKLVNFLTFIGILILAIFLRFYKLHSIPSGFYVDEAAIGYNAYSLLKTGADEYGKSWPVFLRSYNAYSSPLYMYVTTIPIFLWGLSVQSTRFLSVISGTMSIILVYQILSKFEIIKAKYSILIGTTVFAISPWAVFYSRGAFEANFALLLLLLSVWLILKSKENLNYYFLSVAVLALSTYAYQAQRLTAVIFAIYFTIWIFRPKNIQSFLNKYILISISIFIIILIPQLMVVASPAFGSRASGLFYGDWIVIQANKIPFPFSLSYPLAFIREFGAKIFSYLSLKNLFHLPDPDLQRSIPELSVFYSWLAVPFVVGTIVVIDNLKNRYVQMIVFMVITITLAPSLTRDPFSTLRSLGLILPITIIITFGLDKIITHKPKLAIPVIFTLMIFSLVQLWRSYFVLLPSLRAVNWDYGYEILASEILKRPDVSFVVDQSRSNPIYIELAFFMQTDPKLIQNNAPMSVKENYYGGDEFDSYYKFVNVETRNIDWSKDIYSEKILVGDTLAISDTQAEEHELSEVFRISDLLGNDVFVGYETNPSAKCIKENYKNPLCDSFVK